MLALNIARGKPSVPIAAVLTLVSIPIIIARLEIGVVLALIINASIMHASAVPQPLKLGGQGLNAAELLAFLLLAVVFLKSMKEKTPGVVRNPFLLPLLLFGVSIGMSLLYSYLQGMSPSTAWYSFQHSYATARPLFGYVLFFGIAFSLQTERQIRVVVYSALAIASIVAIMIVIQYFLGTETKIFFGTAAMRVEELSKEAKGVTRSLPPGSALIVMMFPVAVVLSVLNTGRARAVHSSVVMLLCAGLVFLFTRNYWLTSMLSVATVWLVVKGTHKWKMITIGGAVLVLAVVGTLSAMRLSAKGGEEFSKALSERFTSTFDKSTYELSSSMTNRWDEDRYAIEQIRRHPIFGIGVGNAVCYKQYTHPWRHTTIRYPVDYIHNSYLELWEVYGILGITSFLWLSWVFLRRSYQVFRRARNAFQSALGIGLFAAYIGYLLRAAVTMSVLHEPFNIASVALAWGVIEALYRLQSSPEASASGEPAPPARKNAFVYANGGGTHQLGVRKQPRRILTEM